MTIEAVNAGSLLGYGAEFWLCDMVGAEACKRLRTVGPQSFVRAIRFRIEIMYRRTKSCVLFVVPLSNTAMCGVLLNFSGQSAAL